MALKPADIATVSRLLDDGLALEPAEREAWLAALPPEHQRHAEALRDMLAQAAQLDTDPRLAAMPKLASDDAVACAGNRIGPYRLLHEIGRGGMGSVWLAERADGAYKRQVALKLPRLAWGAGLAERMAREREIGMLLEHPGIARLYDAGVDERGRPYLALEFVDGQPIDAWCDAQGLSVRDRLRLFVQVIKAVAYAHGRLVVHRDLKPSNVLVTPDGQARLLDFGIAKLLHDAAPGEPGLTQDQGRVLTPHYASPEQVAGEAITVQSDVYSLGVLLYELLTGVLPIAPKRSTLGAVEEAILAGDAPLASSRVKDRTTARALRGEVDAILAKAMQREPARRYATADALAQDIERHLGGETVSARPDSAAYRLRKAVGRHWVGFGAGAAVIVVALCGSLVVALQWQRAASAAERERLIKAFVSDVFRSYTRTDASKAAPLKAAPQTIVEASARLIESRFKDQPRLQADLYAVVGGVFSDMGAYRLAADYSTRRLDTLERAPADRLERARALTTLAQTLFDDERIAQARSRSEEALALAHGQPALEADAQVLLARALIEQGKIEAALATLDKVDGVRAADSPAPQQPQTTTARAWAKAARARLLVIQNRQDDAIAVYDQAIALALDAEGPLSTTAITIRLYIANVLAETVTYAALAKTLHDPAVAALRELGGAHEVRAAFESARFVALRNQLVGSDSTPQILASLQQSRAALMAAPFPLPEWFVPQVDYWMGVTHINDGNIATGLPLLEATAPLLLQMLESPNRRRRVATFFGRTLMVAGQHDLAEGYLRESLEARLASGMGKHPWAAINYRDLATNYLMAGRYAEAESILDQAPAFPALRGEGMSPVRYGRSLVWTRARVRLMSGKPIEALQLLGGSAPAADEVAEDRRAYLPVYGEALCAVGRRAEGLAALRQQLAHEEGQGLAPQAPQLARLRSVAGLCALNAGDRPTAVRLGALARTALLAQPGVSPFYKTASIQLDTRLGVQGVARVAPRGDRAP